MSGTLKREHLKGLFRLNNLITNNDIVGLIDWLNKNMFDFRGLIPKGLAIEVTEDNNPYKD